MEKVHPKFKSPSKLGADACRVVVEHYLARPTARRSLHNSVQACWQTLVMSWYYAIEVHAQAPMGNTAVYDFGEGVRVPAISKCLPFIGPWASLSVDHARPTDLVRAVVISWAEATMDIDIVYKHGGPAHALVVFGIAYPALYSANPFMAAMYESVLLRLIIDTYTHDHEKLNVFTDRQLSQLDARAQLLAHTEMPDHNPQNTLRRLANFYAKQDVSKKAVDAHDSIYARMDLLCQRVLLSDSLDKTTQHTFEKVCARDGVLPQHYSVVSIDNLKNNHLDMLCLDHAEPYALVDTLSASAWDYEGPMLLPNVYVSQEDRVVVALFDYLMTISRQWEGATVDGKTDPYVNTELRSWLTTAGIATVTLEATADAPADTLLLLNVGKWADFQYERGSSWATTLHKTISLHADGKKVRLSAYQHVVADHLIKHQSSVFSGVVLTDDVGPALATLKQTPSSATRMSTESNAVDEYLQVKKSDMLFAIRGVMRQFYWMRIRLKPHTYKERLRKQNKTKRAPAAVLVDPKNKKQREPNTMVMRTIVSVDGLDTPVDFTVWWSQKYRVPMVYAGFLKYNGKDIAAEVDHRLTKLRLEFEDDALPKLDPRDVMDYTVRVQKLTRQKALKDLQKRLKAEKTPRKNGKTYYMVPTVRDICRVILDNAYVLPSVMDTWHHAGRVWFKTQQKVSDKNKRTREKKREASIKYGDPRFIRFSPEEDEVVIRLMRPGVTQNTPEGKEIMRICDRRIWSNVVLKAAQLRNRLIAQGVYDLDKLPHLNYNSKLLKTIDKAKKAAAGLTP